MAAPVVFDTERKAKFLLGVRMTGALQMSARDAGISPSTVRQHLKTDPNFQSAYDEALGDFKEAIEQEAVRRAIAGWEEEVYQQGEYVGTVRKFDSRVLELLLKRHIPEFKEKYEVQHHVQPGTLAVPMTATEAEWEKIHASDAEVVEADEANLLSGESGGEQGSEGSGGSRAESEGT